MSIISPNANKGVEQHKKEIRKLEKDSVTLRRDEQTRLRFEAIQRGDHKTAKAIKYRSAAERTKQMYQKLCYICGIQKTGISRLEVPQDPTNFDYKKFTEWITIDTPLKRSKANCVTATSATLCKCMACSRPFPLLRMDQLGCFLPHLRTHSRRHLSPTRSQLSHQRAYMAHETMRLP